MRKHKAAAADASGTFSGTLSSPQHAEKHHAYSYSNGAHDTDDLVDVPLSTSAQQHAGSAAASSLAKENAALKARLQVVEEAAAEALGELQDLKDELEAHKEARHAAERQVGALGPGVGRWGSGVYVDRGHRATHTLVCT